MKAEIDFSVVMATLCRVIAGSAGPGLVFLALVAGVGTLFDVKGWTDSGGLVLVTGFNWAAGYVLLVVMLRRADLFDHGQLRGAGSYFVCCIVAELGVLLGLIALLVPGIVLIVRWMPAYAILLAEGESIFGSLAEAWQRTRGHFVPLGLAGLVCTVPIFAAVLFYAAAELAPAAWITGALAFANLSFAGALLTWTGLTVAAHDLVRASRTANSD